MTGPIKLFGLKNCDTTRKAMKALDAEDVAYEFHDVRDERLTEAQVSVWLAAVGSDVLVNKRSTTWRGLTAAEREQTEDAASLTKLLVAHPTLIKRPVIVSSDGVSAGWPAKP